MINTYDVELDELRSDLELFLNELIEEGLVEEIND